MNLSQGLKAFGAPGIEPRWTSSAKEGLGTAYHTSCRLWFTLSHGIVNEIYYPSVDQPNTRDFQFLISDGETFCHEEKRDLEHRIEYPERDCVFYRLTNSEPGGRYRLIKAHPHRSASSVLLGAYPARDAGPVLTGEVAALRAAGSAPGPPGRGQLRLVLGSRRQPPASCRARGRAPGHGVRLRDLSRRSVGYVGASDGWQDLMDNFRMDWEFQRRRKGQHRADRRNRSPGRR